MGNSPLWAKFGRRGHKICLLRKNAGNGLRESKTERPYYGPPALQFFMFFAAARKIVNNFDCQTTDTSVSVDAGLKLTNHLFYCDKFQIICLTIKP
jgi:hypothetical protein